MTNDFGMQVFYSIIKIMFERMEENLVRLHDLIDKAIEKYPDNRSFQIYKSRVSIPEEFEFPIVGDTDEDVGDNDEDVGDNGEEEIDDDDDDEDDGNDNEGNNADMNDDDDGNNGDAGLAVGGNFENDENEYEDVGGNGSNEEELNDINNVIDNVVESDLASQFAIQLTQVESLIVQSSAGIIFYNYISIKFS
jgi:hypothetical protein